MHEKAQICREFVITVPAAAASLQAKELPAEAFVPVTCRATADNEIPNRLRGDGRAQSRLSK